LVKIVRGFDGFEQFGFFTTLKVSVFDAFYDNGQRKYFLA
jgi:hypothetical protein